MAQVLPTGKKLDLSRSVTHWGMEGVGTADKQGRFSHPAQASRLAKAEE